MHTETATTIMAIMPPLEIAIDPWSAPAAPAAESPLPGEDPASPAAGPRHRLITRSSSLH